MAVAFSTTVSGYTYQFDWLNEFIYTDASQDDISVEELYTAIKRAQGSVQGVPHPEIATASGLDELSDGVQTFITVRIFREWEIRSLKTSGKVTTQGGNIIKDNRKDPFFDDGSIFYVAFFSQAGVKTTVATGSGVTEQDKQDIKNLIFNEMIETVTDFKGMLRLIGAEAAGKVAISGNTVIFRDVDDQKDRITATTDANGQRTAITTDTTD
jgi:hypothetical protein